MRNKQKLWTKEEINFLLNNLHLQDKVIAVKLNRSIYSIRGKGRQYYKKKNSSVRYSLDLGFFSKWGNRMAYILGFIFADGFIRKEKTKAELRIKIKDIKLLKKINDALGSNYPIKSEKTETGVVYFLSIYRMQVVDNLFKLGLTSNKSLTMLFPEIPSHYLFHFIRGYFDGDGHVSLRKNSLTIGFTCGSRSFLLQLKSLLEAHDIRCSFYESNRKSISYNLIILAEGRKSFYQLLYKDAKIYLERKFIIFKKFFEEIEDVYRHGSCIDCGNEFYREKKRNHTQKRCKSCQSEANKERYKRYYRKKKLRNI